MISASSRSTSQSANSRVTTNGLLSISSQIIWGAQGFITFVIAGRYLPQTEFGFVVVANAILFGCQCLLLGPITNPTLRLGAISSKSLKITYWVYCVVTATVCATFLLLSTQVGGLIYNDPAFFTLIRYLSIPFVTTSFYAVQKLAFCAKMRYKTVLIMDILFMTTNIATLLVFRSNAMLSSAVSFYLARSAAALAGLIPVVYAYAWSQGAARPRVEERFARKEYFQHTGYSLISMLSAFGQGQADALAVAHFLTPLTAATYGAAKIFYTGMTMVTNGLIMVVLPVSSRLSNSGNGGLSRFYLKALLLAYAILLPGAAVLAALTGPVLRVCFGDRYADAAPIVRIFCIAALVMPLSAITDAVANGAGWWRRACAAAVAGGVTGIAASLYLTRSLGVTGAALAPILAMVSSACVISWLTWDRLRPNNSALNVGLPCVATLEGTNK